MFYRRTLPVFKETFSTYDIIVNGIEVGAGNAPILSLEDQKQLKRGSFIIDTAADAGNTIEGNHFTTMKDSIYKEKAFITIVSLIHPLWLTAMSVLC